MLDGSVMTFQSILPSIIIVILVREAGCHFVNQGGPRYQGRVTGPFIYPGSVPSNGLSSTSQCDYDRECFNGQANCAIARALPFQRTIETSCEECLRKCREMVGPDNIYRCKAAVFDHAYNACDLFAVTGQDGYPLVSYTNRDLFVVLPGCSGSGPGPTDGPLPDGATCPAGQVARYISINDASQQFAGDTQTFPAGSRDECIQACTDNRGPDGNVIPCRAVAFDGNQCEITMEVVEPRGPGSLITQPGTEYLEKYCFPEDAVGNCADIFEKYPQYVLVGFARQVVTVNSFDECLNECIRAQQTFGFNCLSGMYYYEDGENCILNSESKDTQPDLFGIDDRGDVVDYFQPDCGAARRLRHRQPKGRSSRKKVRRRPIELDDAKRKKLMQKARPKIKLNQWTEWSTCNLEMNRQVRYKRCIKIRITNCPRVSRSCLLHKPAAKPRERILIKKEKKTKKRLKNKKFRRRQPKSGALRMPVSHNPLLPRESKRQPANVCRCMLDRRGRKDCSVGAKVVIVNGKRRVRSCKPFGRSKTRKRKG